MDTNEPNVLPNNDDVTFLNDNPDFVVTGNESEAGDEVTNGSVARTTIDTDRTSVLQLIKGWAFILCFKEDFTKD
jgi:hypothetical protein